MAVRLHRTVLLESEKETCTDGGAASSADMHPHAQPFLDLEAERFVEPADCRIGRPYLEVDLDAARPAQRADGVANEGCARAAPPMLRRGRNWCRVGHAMVFTSIQVTTFRREYVAVVGPRATVGRLGCASLSGSLVEAAVAVRHHALYTEGS